MHGLKKYLGRLLEVIDFPIPAGDLIVINYHGTPSRFMQSFEKQVAYFSKRFKILNKQQFDSFYTEPAKQIKTSLYISFDDGLKNNLHAVEVLNKYGFKASFCLIPEFMECSTEDQPAYYKEHIRPMIDKTTGYKLGRSTYVVAGRPLHCLAFKNAYSRQD